LRGRLAGRRRAARALHWGATHLDPFPELLSMRPAFAALLATPLVLAAGCVVVDPDDPPFEPEPPTEPEPEPPTEPEPVTGPFSIATPEQLRVALQASLGQVRLGAWELATTLADLAALEPPPDCPMLETVDDVTVASGDCTLPDGRRFAGTVELLVRPRILVARFTEVHVVDAGAKIPHDGVVYRQGEAWSGSLRSAIDNIPVTVQILALRCDRSGRDCVVPEDSIATGEGVLPMAVTQVDGLGAAQLRGQWRFEAGRPTGVAQLTSLGEVAERIDFHLTAEAEPGCVPYTITRPAEPVGFIAHGRLCGLDWRFAAP
jgi:hypothetical protein